MLRNPNFAWARSGPIATRQKKTGSGGSAGMASSAADADYQSLVFDYARSADQDATAPVRHHAIIVGAGPVGLATAIDLAQQGITTLLLDDDDRLSTGSRAICFAKRTLEIFD